MKKPRKLSYMDIRYVYLCGCKDCIAVTYINAEGNGWVPHYIYKRLRHGFTNHDYQGMLLHIRNYGHKGLLRVKTDSKAR